MGMVIEKQVYLTSDLLEAISKRTGIFWSDMLGMEPYVHEAVRFWLNPPAQLQAQAQPQAQATMAGDSGYQWKQVFLPAGTRLRASFGRAAYFATVEGDEITHEGLAMSPSCFANLHGSGNRNAWRAVWLNFPGSAQWLLADTCRLLQVAAAQRLFAPDQPAATTGEPLAKALPAVAREPLNRQPLNRKPLNRKPTPGPRPQALVPAPASPVQLTSVQAAAPAGAVVSDVRVPKARAPGSGASPGNGSRSRSRRRRRAKKQAPKPAGVSVTGPVNDPSAP